MKSKIGISLMIMVCTSLCTFGISNYPVINPIQNLKVKYQCGINTTKITTEEGTYRIFIYNSCSSGSGITATKIK